MTKRRIPHRVTSQQTGDAETAWFDVRAAQAAAWMLRELEGRLGAFDDATFVNRDDEQTPEELREALKWMALDCLWEKLGEARRELDAMSHDPKAVA